MSRRYAKKGDKRPRKFKVGDMIVNKTGEVGLVTEVFNAFEKASTSIEEWHLRLSWVTKYTFCPGTMLCSALAESLSIEQGPHLYPVEESE